MKARRVDTFALAGWLFADLLLALAVLFAASSGFGVAHAAIGSPTPTPASPTPTVTPTPSPTPSPSPSAASISVTSICRHVNVRGTALLAGDPAAADEAVKAVGVAFNDLANLRGALVLTFGTAANGGRAKDLAHALNALLKSDQLKVRVGPLFTGAETRDYILLNFDPGKDGEMWLELFLPPPVPTAAKSDEGCPR